MNTPAKRPSALERPPSVPLSSRDTESPTVHQSTAQHQDDLDLLPSLLVQISSNTDGPVVTSAAAPVPFSFVCFNIWWCLQLVKAGFL